MLETQSLGPVAEWLCRGLQIPCLFNEINRSFPVFSRSVKNKVLYSLHFLDNWKTEMLAKLRNVHAVTGRNGRKYHYHRPTGTRLNHAPGSPEFIQRVDELNRQVATINRETTSYIYFIQMRAGPVKIGTANDVARRFTQIATTCPEPIELLGIIRGGPRYERRLHVQFKHLLLSGEWFRPTIELMKEIDRLLTEFEKNEQARREKWKTDSVGFTGDNCTHGGV